MAKPTLAGGPGVAAFRPTNNAMLTLETLIAEHVLGTLVKRQLLRVAHASHELLRNELELAVAPLLSSVTPYLMAVHLGSENVNEGFGDCNADEAVAVMIDSIGDRLSHSNHIDDIFVDDATLRRDALRATRHVLHRYMRGELEIAADGHPEPRFVVALDSLGYVVAASAPRVANSMLTQTLVAAAKEVGAHLERFDATTRTAFFGAVTENASLLAIEEAVTGELVALVDSGQVLLPCVEQVFELSAPRLPRRALLAALQRAAVTIEKDHPCRATCETLAPRRIRLAITPLTSDAAQHADTYFAELVALVESAIDALDATPASAAPESAPAISQTRSRSSAKEARPTVTVARPRSNRAAPTSAKPRAKKAR